MADVDARPPPPCRRAQGDQDAAAARCRPCAGVPRSEVSMTCPLAIRLGDQAGDGGARQAGAADQVGPAHRPLGRRAGTVIARLLAARRRSEGSGVPSGHRRRFVQEGGAIKALDRRSFRIDPDESPVPTLMASRNRLISGKEYHHDLCTSDGSSSERRQSLPRLAALLLPAPGSAAPAIRPPAADPAVPLQERVAAHEAACRRPRRPDDAGGEGRPDDPGRARRRRRGPVAGTHPSAACCQVVGPCPRRTPPRHGPT